MNDNTPAKNHKATPKRIIVMIAGIISMFDKLVSERILAETNE